MKAVALLEEYHTRKVTEHSANLYNNLSNTYLLMGKSEDAVTTLKVAFEVRQKMPIMDFLKHSTTYSR